MYVEMLNEESTWIVFQKVARSFCVRSSPKILWLLTTGFLACNGI